MANIYDWSVTAADNDDAGTPINWAENQAPSTVNNSAREMMAQIADWRNLVGAAKITATADTMTLTSGLSLTAYAQGMMIGFECGAANTGATTLNIDSVGAKAVVKFHDVPLVSGDLEAGGIYIVAYEATADNFQLVSPSSLQPATLTGTETLTNKTFDLTDNTLNGTLAELNTAVSDATLASLTGSETLTNKTLTSPVINTGVSGTAIDTDTTMAANSDTILASQKATKAYVDGVMVPGLGTVTNVATGGIATGGPITGSGTVTVTKASAAEVSTGTEDAKAVTPLAMADALLGANNLSDVGTAATSFDNISPMTTQGDMIRGGASGANERVAIGASGTVLTSDGNDADWAISSGRLVSIQTFSASGTWTKPAGVVSIMVEVMGGGGGGGGVGTTSGIMAGGGGGQGGTAIEFIDVSGTASETVTIGAGGAGGVGALAGSTGGVSSLGALISAGGGLGGTSPGASAGVPGSGGAGGLGVGGDKNFTGESGATAEINAAHPRGGTGGGKGGAAPANSFTSAGVAGTANSGGGGSGAQDTTTTSRNGGAGGSGYIIVWEYS